MKAKPKGGFRFFLKVHLLLFIFSQSASFAIYFFSKCIFYEIRMLLAVSKDATDAVEFSAVKSEFECRKKSWGGQAHSSYFSYSRIPVFFVYLVFCCFSDCIFYEIRRLQLLGVKIEQGKRSCR